MKSTLFLSMHKAGSSIADRIVMQVLRARGYRIDRIAPQAARSELLESEFFHRYQPKMTTRGVYYGVARHPDSHDMEILPRLRVIVQMRDPRDCITSAYYSFLHSHRPPTDPEKRRRFDERRAWLRDQSIDDYAPTLAEKYRNRVEVLDRVVRSHPDLLLLRYEEMVEDTGAWLSRISEFTGQPLTPDLRETLAPLTDFRRPREEPGRHKRQITPGDHRRKMKPETIAGLNAVLGDALPRFGYAP